MAYDRLAASLRLLGSGITADPGRLSRRRRMAAIAYDIRADLAATWFVRRGHPVPHHEIDLFVRQDGHWRPLCGGGFGDGDDHLSDRPSTDVLGAPLVRGGSGGSIPPDVPGPVPDEFPALTPCGYTTLRAARSVVRVAFDHGGDATVVPRHGNVIVVWWHRPPVARALDADGACLATVDLTASRGLPPPFW